jgi:hypothetical protein
VKRKAGRYDVIDCFVDDACYVPDNVFEIGIASATAEEDERVAARIKARLMKQLYQATPDDRVVAVSIIRSLIGAPDRQESRRLRPQPQTIVVVVREYDASSRPHRVCHVTHDLQRVENEASVRDIKLTQLVITERGIEDVALSHLKDGGFAVGRRLASGLVDLFGVSLDAEHRHSGRSGHHPRVLAEAGPEVDDAFTGDQTRGLDATLVETSVQRGQPLLLGFTRSMRIMG